MTEDEINQFSNLVCGATSAAPLGGRFTNLQPLRNRAGLQQAGAFSVMFTAFDERTSSEVAVKFLQRDADKYRVDCFHREAEVSKQLVGKDNITQLVGDLDVLTIPAQTQWGIVDIRYSYIALERAKENLEAFLIGRRRSKPLFRRLQVLRDVVKGLNRLHNAGFCHRDLKPDNILLFRGGVAKLADLGTARLINGSDRLHSNYLFPMGHLRYAAPEMFSGAGFIPSLYVGADWFGVGAILFEAVTNQNLWVAVGLSDPIQVKRTIAASMNISTYLQTIGTASSRYPIPSTEDYASESWLQHISSGTHECMTALIRSLCDFDFRRRLTNFERILARLDLCIGLAQRDHRKYLA